MLSGESADLLKQILDWLVISSGDARLRCGIGGARIKNIRSEGH